MSVELQRQIVAKRNLLGISNTLTRNAPPLEHARPDLEWMFKGVHELVFIPYALHDMDAYIEKMTPVFNSMGIEKVKSPHKYPNQEAKVIEDAECIFIGGGNTGRLVANLHALRNFYGPLVDKRPDAAKNSLVEAIRQKAAEGIAIIGSSAGLNVMCKDVRTTNDMQAAVQIMADGNHLLRVDALGLLPDNFSFNPHFQDKVTISDEEREKILAINPQLRLLTDHQGESRIDRLMQILEMDQSRVILALREGSYVVVKGQAMEMKGNTGGIVFRYGKEPQSVNKGDKLDDLLNDLNDRP